MEECVKLNGKMIVCMIWNLVTLLLHIAKIPKQQYTDENPRDVATSEASSHLVWRADKLSDGYFTTCEQAPGQPNSLFLKYLVSVPSNCQNILW